MATLDDIDFTRSVRFVPVMDKQWDDPELVTLSIQLDNPNLTRVSTPLDVDDLILEGVDACVFWGWLNSSPHRKVVEEDLQSLSETNKSEPLLSTWLERPQFLSMIHAAQEVGILPDLSSTLTAWQGAGAEQVFLDGFQKT